MTAHDHDAEAQVLGAALYTAGKILDHIDLRPDEFDEPRNALVWAAVLALHRVGSPTTIQNVAAELRKDDKRDWNLVLFDLEAGLVTPAAAEDCARRVRDTHARRAGDMAALELRQHLGDMTVTTPEAIETCRGVFDTLAERISVGADHDLERDLDATLASIETGTAGLPTPWRDLNDKIGGWRPGAVYVIAARPGGGKSIAGVQAAAHAAATGSPAAVVSLEMSRAEILSRLLSATARVDLGHLTRGGNHMTDDDWAKIAAHRGAVADLPLVIDDRASVTTTDIRGAVRATRKRHGTCGLLVIDYLQLMTSGRRVENRQTEIAAISRDVKVLAKDLQVPVLLLSQLNRAADSQGRPPRLSDLRESGAIEQDADVVLLLHRDEDKSPDEVMVAIGKNRHGPTGGLHLTWQGNYSRLMDRAWKPSDALRGVA